MIIAFAAIVLAQAASAAPAPVSAGPVVMTGKQIKEYNATLSRNDLAYIRCEKVLETGSLVKKTRLCRTNGEWRRLADIGNDTARDMQERYIQQSFSSPQEPGG